MHPTHFHAIKIKSKPLTGNFANSGGLDEILHNVPAGPMSELRLSQNHTVTQYEINGEQYN